MESITAEAVKAIKETAKVEDLEEDWVAYLFKNCDTVSDKEMQSLWSRLLSGEANQPGTYSKRTVEFIGTMDKKDAELFTTFCQFCWIQNDLVVPMITSTDHEIYSNKEINFGTLKHLDSIGLISFEAFAGYRRRGLAKYTYFHYFGKTVVIEFSKEDNNEMDIGKVILTKIGAELSPICGPEINEEFYFHIVKKWFSKNYVLFSPIPNK